MAGTNKSSRQNPVREEVLKLLRRHGRLKLIEIASMLNEDSEKVRKILNRLEKKGVVQRLGHGIYTISSPEEPTEIPLDFFTLISSPPLTETGISISHINAAKLRKRLIELRSKTELPIQFIPKLDTHLTNLREWRKSRMEDLLVAFIAGDESSRPIRYRARALTKRSSRLVTFITLSSILRLGASMEAIEKIEGLDRRIELERGDIRYLPRDVDKGVPELEFLLKRFQGKYLHTPAQDYYESMPVVIASEVAAKTREYELEEFKLSVLQYLIASAKRLETYDYVLITSDGSLLPGHLDPHIRPGSEKLSRWPSEIAKEILEWKKKIMLQYASLYQLVESSDNIVFAGVMKSSNDRTLTWRLLAEEVGMPDQYLLSFQLKDGDVVCPFRPHRVGSQWPLEARALNIPHEKINVWLCYIKKAGFLATPIHLVVPRSFEQEDVKVILGILYNVITSSEKHTRLGYTDLNSQYLGERSTTIHIRIVDEMVSQKAKEVAEIVENELNLLISQLEYKLFELALRYNLDFGLFYYSVLRHELSPRKFKLRRSGG